MKNSLIQIFSVLAIMLAFSCNRTEPVEPKTAIELSTNKISLESNVCLFPDTMTTVSILNSNIEDISFSINYLSEKKGWLKVSIDESTNPQSIIIETNLEDSDLEEGTYNAELTVIASNASNPQVVDIDLVLKSTLNGWGRIIIEYIFEDRVLADFSIPFSFERRTFGTSSSGSPTINIATGHGRIYKKDLEINSNGNFDDSSCWGIGSYKFSFSTPDGCTSISPNFLEFQLSEGDVRHFRIFIKC